MKSATFWGQMNAYVPTGALPNQNRYDLLGFSGHNKCQIESYGGDDDIWQAGNAFWYLRFDGKIAFVCSLVQKR